MNKKTCREDWLKMTPELKGRFCDVCSKPVKDFTNWERKDIIEFYKKHPLACGRFRMEQLDPNLIPFPSLKKIISIAAFFTGAFIFSNNVSAQTIDKPKTEQVTPIDNANKAGTLSNNQTSSTDNQTGTSKQYTKSESKSSTRIHRKLYFTRWFPFIHYGYRHWMGCPRF